MQKNLVRKNCLTMRKSLAKNIQQAHSRTICKKILSIPNYQTAKKIGLYNAINNEVDLHSLWHEHNDNQKTFYFPKVTSNKHMCFLPIAKNTLWHKNKWNILEPNTLSYLQEDSNNLEIIFLPIVAFDEQCNRIGMGGGYYDRLLEGNNFSLLIGVGYEFQKQPSIKPETWDIKLDIIVTEKKMYKV